MGGFKPSRADIAGSTIVGSDKDLDTHAFTGSVDITGSLTLNGSAVTGGGGGGTPGGADTQVQYNDSGAFAGSANFTFDGTNIAVSDDADATANIGRAHIGYNGTSDEAIFAHRDRANTTDYALLQRADGDTILNTRNGGTLYLRTGGNSPALIVAGGSKNNIGINTPFPTARLHVSASSIENDVLRVDGPGTNLHALYVSGSGRVGIGTGTPLAQLHISASVGADGNLLRLDHADAGDDNPILFVSGSGLVGIGTATPNYALHVADDTNAFFVGSEGGSNWFDIKTGTITFNQAGGITKAGGIDLGQRFNIAPISATKGTLGIGQFPGSDKNVVEVNSANSDQGGDWFVIDQSGSVGIGVTSPTAVLHISSSTGTDLFKVEHLDSTDNPIFVITGSSGGRIGILTDTPSAVVDIHPQNSPGNNEVKIRGSAAVSHFYTTAGEDTYIRGGTQSSHVVLSDVRNAGGTNNQKLSIGDAGTLTTAKMHLSSSDTPTVLAVTSNSGSILTALENQRVGIGTGTPTQALDVADDTDVAAAIGRAHIGYITGYSDSAFFAHRDRATISDYALLQQDNGDTHINAPLGRTLSLKIQNNHALVIAGGYNNNIGINTTTPQARLHVSASSAESDVLRVDGDVNNANALYVSGSGHVGIGTGTPIQTLSVSGSAAFSGAFGSTAIETKSTDLGVLSATDGVSIIDLTAAAINTSFTFSIDNGTFIGQQKSVYFKTIVGADGANSNAATLAGTNIDSNVGNPVGSLSLSGSDFGEGFGGFARSGAILLWDGTNWAPISITYLDWF